MALPTNQGVDRNPIAKHATGRVPLRRVQLLFTGIVPFLRKRAMSWQLHSTTYTSRISINVHRQGERKKLRCWNRTKSSGGELLRRGKSSRAPILLGGNVR